MAFTYCPSCGYKNLHGVNAPKFCGGCGEVLGGSATPPAPRTKMLNRTMVEARRNTTSETAGDEEGTDIETVPNIKALKYTISEGEFGANKANLEDLVGEITEEQLQEVQAEERGERKKKRGRLKGNKNLTHGKRRTKRK